MKRFIITGVGRTGTKYIAHTMRANGIHCGHENVFTAKGFRGWNGYQGESSWLAVPFLEDYKDCVRIHVTRHPLKVIGSLRGINWYRADTIHAQYFDTYCPKLRLLGEADACTLRWLIWSRWADAGCTYRRKLEDIDIGELFTLCGYQGSNWKEASHDTNHRRHTVTKWTDISSYLRPLVMDLARTYGYEC